MVGRRRFALGDLPVALLLVAPSGRVIEATADASVQLGLGATDLVGADLLALVDSPQRSPLRDALKEALDAPAHPILVSTEIRVGSALHAAELTLKAVPVPDADADAARAGDVPLVVLVGVQSRAGQRRLEATLDAMADTTLLLDINGLVEWQSGTSAARLPEGAASGIGVNPLERLHPEDLPNTLDLWASAVTAEGTRVSYVARSRAVEDDDLWQLIEINGSSQLQNPYLQAMVVQIRNLDDGQVVPSVAEVEGPMQSLADAAPIAIVVTDAYNRTIYRNEAAKALLEQPELRPAQEWRELVRAQHRPEIEAILQRISMDGGAGAATVAMDLPSGKERWLDIVVTARHTDGVRATGLIITMEDVTAEVEAKAEAERLTHMLRQLATHDHLTELPNRALFNDRLQQAVARHRREGTGVAVMFCDLDGFKAVNDEHGHAAGDHLLVTVAARLRMIIRETDTAARVGGDEFVIVGEGMTAAEELATMAERVIEAVGQPVTLPSGVPVRVGISVGVGVAREADRDVDADALLTTADTAMYRAKAHGGNTFRIA